MAKEKLNSKIESWGFACSKNEYYKILSRCDLVLSTSLHEFFGVAIIEACLLGAYPILPNRLVYPELYPKECLYSTEAQLLKKLKYICTRPKLFRLTRQKNAKMLCEKYAHHENKDEILSRLIEDASYFNQFKWSLLKNKFISLCNFSLLL